MCLLFTVHAIFNNITMTLRHCLNVEEKFMQLAQVLTSLTN